MTLSQSSAFVEISGNFTLALLSQTLSTLNSKTLGRGHVNLQLSFCWQSCLQLDLFLLVTIGFYSFCSV